MCGEHTTHSAGWNDTKPPEYPARVGALLAASSGMHGATVENFGFATAVVTSQVGDLAKAGQDGKQGKARVYAETDEAAACVAFGPDVIVLGPFGKHDALGPFSTHNNFDDAPLFTADEYADGLKKLVGWAQLIAGASKVLLALPIPYPYGSTAHTTSTVVLPATERVAAELSLETIDLHSVFAGREDAFTDPDHLTEEDIDLLAQTVAAAVRPAAKL